MNEILKSKRIVLLGIGHTNAHVLRRWLMEPIEDTELVCISDHLNSTYSGMLPAVLAQQRPETAMNIDLVKLCAAANSTLITSEVVGVNAEQREIKFSDRPPLDFDLLSIGVGSRTKKFPAVLGSEGLVAIKPMQTFIDRLRDRINLVSRSGDLRPLKIAIVGGGVASVEIALCIPSFLRCETERPFQVSLISGGKRITPELPKRTADTLATALKDRSIEIYLESRVINHTESAVELQDGNSVGADIIIASTGASPPDVLSRLVLPKDDHGFLLTKPTLQSTGSEAVFAVGDCGTIEKKMHPKAGVYAVRQGPVLWENLNRSLSGQSLSIYKPQTKVLKLINLGDGRALAHRWSFSLAGRWAMRWKHRIDDRFISMYQRPVAKNMTTVDGSRLDEQCRGCGCKLDSESLSGALTGLNSESETVFKDSITIHDNGVEEITGSIDFFTAPFSDAYLSGRIAALHSMSDLVAGGAKPESALSTLVLCDGPKGRQQEQFKAITSGINRELQPFGFKIGGGHTIVGPRTEIGLAVMGRRPSGFDAGKHQLKTDEKLFLTKPLGTGVLMAAHMRGQCESHYFEHLLKLMLQPLHPWLELIQSLQLRAVTDITGFGLAGHLLEMLSSSNKHASIVLDSIPVMPGVAESIQSGVQSTLYPDNLKQRRWIQHASQVGEHQNYPCLFDPQTCGGLVFGIKAGLIEPMFEKVKQLSLPQPYEIGWVTDPDRVKSEARLTIV